MMQTKHYQQGYLLVAAIFLLIGLAALGAFMVKLSDTQHLTSAQDIQGSRAYWAARSGLEWAAATIDASDAARSTCHSATIDIDGFSVQVSEEDCSASLPPSYSEGGISYLHRIVSTAGSGGAVGSLGYIERSLTATMEFCTPKATC
ncbi:hypothetical protein [Candidatus Methylobacter oryzae]|uniref:MSHA biogenesis protein MshP n=1 Tax=Candidatus Methylobacter oryzae TaxID=2497749 RepID=A0ABY3C9T6_9GAMM|nr:hypothetical protein [Candidatus Methylobacter oryzae]TRW94329.1 hypothetical protein EKO24_012060 [Candidatus Methylobacter oryzae]